MGAEEKDVAGHRLDGEVLVDGADHALLGLDHDPVIADFGNGPPAGQCGQASTTARPQDRVDLVAVEVGHARPPAGGDALGCQFDHGVEVLPGQVLVRGGPAYQLVELVLFPLLRRRHLGDDLLGQYVERGEGGQGRRRDGLCARTPTKRRIRPVRPVLSGK